MQDKNNNFEALKTEIRNEIKLLNSKTVCFTGHRSQKLPWGFNEKDERCVQMKQLLRKKLTEVMSMGYDTFLCGMALGFDMICAETVIELKKDFPNVKLIGALPCKTQDSRWSPTSKARYRGLLKQLDGIRCIYDSYIGAECMLERNRYMVNNSSMLIALYDGTLGGTKSTIEYAKQQGLEIFILPVQKEYH